MSVEPKPFKKGDIVIVHSHPACVGTPPVEGRVVLVLTHGALPVIVEHTSFNLRSHDGPVIQGFSKNGRNGNVTIEHKREQRVLNILGNPYSPYWEEPGKAASLRNAGNYRGYLTGDVDPETGNIVNLVYTTLEK